LAATDPKTPGYLSVIWIDEKGNQFPAIYNADGTSTWEAAGTIPARPSQEELAKAGTLSNSEFREFVNKLPNKSSDKDCKTLVPEQPKTPEKTTKTELPKSDSKKPRKAVTHKTNKKAARTQPRQDSGTTSSGTGPAIVPDLGIGIGLGRFGRRGGGGGLGGRGSPKD
jgi:hypothetical protein